MFSISFKLDTKNRIIHSITHNSIHFRVFFCFLFKYKNSLLNCYCLVEALTLHLNVKPFNNDQYATSSFQQTIRGTFLYASWVLCKVNLVCTENYTSFVDNSGFNYLRWSLKQLTLSCATNHCPNCFALAIFSSMPMIKLKFRIKACFNCSKLGFVYHFPSRNLFSGKK